MKNLIDRLTRVQGVLAIMIFNNAGEILQIWHQPEFNEKIIEGFPEGILPVLGIAEQLDYAIEEMVVPFERGIIFVRNYDRLFVAVITKSTVDRALVQLTMDFEMYASLSDKKTRKMLKKFPPSKFDYIDQDKMDKFEKSIFKKLIFKNNGNHQN